MNIIRNSYVQLAIVFVLGFYGYCIAFWFGVVVVVGLRVSVYLLAILFRSFPNPRTFTITSLLVVMALASIIFGALQAPMAAYVNSHDCSFRMHLPGSHFSVANVKIEIIDAVTGDVRFSGNTNDEGDVLGSVEQPTIEWQGLYGRKRWLIRRPSSFLVVHLDNDRVVRYSIEEKLGTVSLSKEIHP